MDFDEKNTDELEAELYSRIHHDKPDNTETVSAEPLVFQHNRTVSKHSVVNNSKIYKMKPSTPKNRKKAIEKCNPNPFAIASAMNNQIPKRLTPYTSYLSQVDSQPIDLPTVQVNKDSTEIEQKHDAHQPNPFNKGFNRAEEKLKRFQLMQAKKTVANRIRENIQHKKQASTDHNIAENEMKEKIAIPIPDSDSDDEVYIYPPEEPTVISSDDDDGGGGDDDANVTVEKQQEPIENLHDDCDHINVDYDKRLSRHDDPFGSNSGIDVAHLNTIISEDPTKNLAPIDETSDNFAKPQRANRHSLKRSYDVSETDFAATDVYESESSDLPESNVSKRRKEATVLSESEGSEIETTKRSKRMRKRRASGSNRGSDCISSDDSDDDQEAYLEPEKSTRPYYLHRGEGVFNAVTKYSKRYANRRNEQSHDISLEAVDSSEDSHANEPEQEQKETAEQNWVVTDEVGETDDIALDMSNLEERTDAEENVPESCTDAKINGEENESNADKDDDNSVRSERLVIHPEMGWNSEMRAFYNDSWGGETHNTLAIRKQMPRDSFEWRLDIKDLRSNYNVLKTIKCHNCRENGHRMAFCPQPKKELVCFTCGNAGHREVRCPYAICLRCGEKTNSFRRGCERCFRISHMICKKCRRRGHLARQCPDNWRAYHNTTDTVSTPVRLPTRPPKKCCSVCSAYGHRAEQCFNYRFLLEDDVISSDIATYEKVYEDDDPPIDNSTTTPYSMFENPRQNFKFIWNVNESTDRFYGRFMEATKFERDAVDAVVSTKRRRKAKIPKINEKLVLNPMNAENIREKPKKQFAKNFYEESSAQQQQQNATDQQIEVIENSENATGNCETAESIEESKNIENADKDNDVVMKEIEPIEKVLPNVDNEKCVQSVCEPIEEDKLMQEAIEVDELRRSNSFSFCKEMDELEKSKTTFDLSFIGTAEDAEHESDDSPTTTKATARKLRKEAEIERLTEMEISLNKLKGELSKKKKKSTDDIVLNISNTNSIHDSDSNYSFSEYFNESKAKDQDLENVVAESPDYIPLPPHIDSIDLAEASETMSSAPINTNAAVNSAKIFLTKQHARLLLSTEAGNKLLSDASSTHQVKVRMDWEKLGNVLIVSGTTANQNKFHAALIHFLLDMCKKMRIKNETFQQIPRSKVALIRFIREQFALLEQPLGNVNELYKNVKRNESLKSKNGTKNADRARKNLNIILMGRAGLREGRLHLAGLESNLKFLLENNKDMMTKHMREEIYQHYRYVFSPFEHDDYPDLIAEYEDLKRAKNFPPLNIDKSLMEIKIAVKDDDSVDLNRAKQKLLRVSNDTEHNQEPVGELEAVVDVALQSEPKTPTRESKNSKREQKTPKQQTKAPNVQTKVVASPEIPPSSSADDPSTNANAVWSLKCKDIVEKCRQKHIKSSKVMEKLNTVLEKASRNQLSYADYKNLEKILNTLNNTV